MLLNEKDVFRFFDKVLIGDGCWEWQANTRVDGYGRLKLAGKNVLTHRIAFQYFYPESFDEKLCVLHRCDNPPCVNPKHLFQGTHEDNSYDKAIKGRAAKKLTKEQAIAIRKDPRKQWVIAEEYGIEQTAVSLIKQGKNWYWLDSDIVNNHHNHVLTEDEVKSIRKDNRVHRLIAEDYGVQRRQISRIKQGTRWSKC